MLAKTTRYLGAARDEEVRKNSHILNASSKTANKMSKMLPKSYGPTDGRIQTSPMHSQVTTGQRRMTEIVNYQLKQSYNSESKEGGV